MKRDVIMPASKFNSSFLSCHKDIETILRKLFIESKPYSDYLKRLLIINTEDCLDTDNPIYNEQIKKSLKEIIDEGYISFIPKIKFGEHEKVKSYLVISIDNFSFGNVTKYIQLNLFTNKTTDEKTCQQDSLRTMYNFYAGTCYYSSLPEKAKVVNYELINTTIQSYKDTTISWKLVYKDQYGRGDTLDITTKFE